MRQIFGVSLAILSERSYPSPAHFFHQANVDVFVSVLFLVATRSMYQNKINVAFKFVDAYCRLSPIVRKKYGYWLRSMNDAPSAEYDMIGMRKCFETPAIGSTVSLHAGPSTPSTRSDFV